MRMKQLEELEQGRKGYRVSFERLLGCILASDYIPDRDEPACSTQAEAWALAHRVASAVENAYNIYVTSVDHVPLSGYRENMLKRRGWSSTD